MCSWVKVEEQWLCLLDLFSFFLDVNQQQLAGERSIISAYFEPCCHHFFVFGDCLLARCQMGYSSIDLNQIKSKYIYLGVNKIEFDKETL